MYCVLCYPSQSRPAIGCDTLRTAFTRAGAGSCLLYSGWLKSQAVSCSEQNGNGTNLTAATGCDDTEPSSAAQHTGARAASTSRSRKYRQLAQRPFCMAGSYAMVAILQRNFDKFSLITYNFIITSTKPEFPFVDEQMRGFCAGYVEFHMQCLICL